MAQKVVNQNEAANPGSRTVTHGTMNIKSNTKGVSEVPTMQTPTVHKEGQKVMGGTIPNAKRVGTHY